MSEPDGFTTGQQIGGGLAAFVSGIFSVQAWKHWLKNGRGSQSDGDKIVEAIDKLRTAVLADLKETRRAMHDRFDRAEARNEERFGEINEQLHDAEVARTAFVAADNARRRGRRGEDSE